MAARKRAREVIPVIALFLITLAFFSDVLFGGGLFVERDLGPFFIPPRYFWVESLNAGEFPLWNPLNFGGYPLFAALQPGVIYPLNVLFFILPFQHAFNWIIIGHYFLAGAFTYALLRFLDAGRGASFLAAAVFLLGGYLLSLHSLLSALLSVVWLPLILLFFGRALRHNSLWNAAFAGACLAVSFFGGGIEIVLSTCIALGLMALLSRTIGGNTIFALKALIITGVVFLCLSAIQLIPFLQLTTQSIRQTSLSYQEAIVWSASPVDLLSLLIQDPYGSLSSDIAKYWMRQSWLKTLYVGGLPFVLAIIYIMKERRAKYFWLILAAVSLFLALGGFNPLYPYVYEFVPTINKIRYPVKFLVLAIFALSVMAGLGLQRLLADVRKGEGSRFRWMTISLATSAAVIFFLLHVQADAILAFLKARGIDSPVYNDAAVNFHNVKRMIFYVIVSSSILWVITRTRGSRYAVAALCLVAVLDLFGNFGYYGWTKPDVYFADNWTVKQVKEGLGEYRMLTTPYTSIPTSTVIAPNIIPEASRQRVIAPSLNLNYGIRDTWGSEVMRVKRTDDLYAVLSASSSVDATRILDIFSTKYVISTKPISSPYFAFVGADIDGLKGDRKKLLNEQTIKIYKNKRVLPRAFLVNSYIVEPDPAQVLVRISKADFNPARIVILEEQPVWDTLIPEGRIEDSARTAEIQTESNSRVEILAKVNQPSLLYLSDTFYPGWKAYVNGIETKIYRANYNFRVVALSPGRHQVEFRYEPLSFYIGAWISGLTVVVLASLSAWSMVVRRRAVSVRDSGDAAVSGSRSTAGKNECRRATRGRGLLEDYLARKRAAMADALIPHGARAGRVLDIGCGTTPVFLSRTEFHEKFGIEQHVNIDMHDSSLQIKEHDLHGGDPLPFEDRFFDAVTMLAVLEHVEPERLSAVIGEIHRVLKPGGVLIITTPSSWTGWILKCMAAVRLVSREEIKDHKKAYGIAELRELINEAGFRGEQVQAGHFELFLNQWLKAEKEEGS